MNISPRRTGRLSYVRDVTKGEDIGQQLSGNFNAEISLFPGACLKKAVPEGTASRQGGSLPPNPATPVGDKGTIAGKG